MYKKMVISFQNSLKLGDKEDRSKDEVIQLYNIKESIQTNIRLISTVN